jgi:hypothetical protein
MSSGHELTCDRPSCGRKFSAKRSDARFCSRRCRRAKSPPAPLVEVVGPAVSTAEEAPAEAEDDLHGWRRMGGYLVPRPSVMNSRSSWRQSVSRSSALLLTACSLQAFRHNPGYRRLLSAVSWVVLAGLRKWRLSHLRDGDSASEEEVVTDARRRPRSRGHPSNMPSGARP